MKQMLILLLLGCSSAAPSLFQVSDCCDSVVINTEGVTLFKDSVELKISLFNLGNNPIRLYMPTVESYCSSVLLFKLIDKNKQEYRMVPCDEIVNLDQIFLNDNNSVVLPSNDSINFGSVLKVMVYPGLK